MNDPDEQPNEHDDDKSEEPLAENQTQTQYKPDTWEDDTSGGYGEGAIK